MTTTTKPKKRGRPPNKTKTAPSAKDKLLKKAKDSIFKESPPLVKRGRGRPPKDKSIETAPIDLALLKQELLLPDAQELIEARMKRSEGVKQVIIPYTPNASQKEVHDGLQRYKFGVVVVHRGFGKTWLALVELVRRAWSCEKADGGLFGYIAPEKLQAKYVAWDKLKFFVRDLPVVIHEADLSISFPNKSVIRLYGADNPHRIRGQHFSYLVLDEVGQMPRDVWSEASYPALQANDGGALFIGTPKGDNFFKEIYDSSRTKPDTWLSYFRTVEQTSVYPKHRIEQFRIEQGHAKFEQEYMCSFDVNSSGSFYDHILNNTELNLVGDVPWDPNQPVMTAWDLGILDATAVWFIQKDKLDSTRLRVIDFYEANEPDFNTHLKAINAKPYLYSHHYMPHDINKRLGLGTLTRYELCRRNGMDIKIATKEVSPMEGISMVQRLLPTCRFDLAKCGKGLAHLKQYSARQDRVSGEFEQEAKKSKHNHAADAFRYLAVGMRKSHGHDAKHLAYAESTYDYFNISASGRSDRHATADYEYDPFNL